LWSLTDIRTSYCVSILMKSNVIKQLFKRNSLDSVNCNKFTTYIRVIYIVYWDLFQTYNAAVPLLLWPSIVSICFYLTPWYWTCVWGHFLLSSLIFLCLYVSQHQRTLWVERVILCFWSFEVSYRRYCQNTYTAFVIVYLLYNLWRHSFLEIKR